MIFTPHSYKVKLDAFEGPLDLLLHLIEKRKLHINDISLAKITDDYLTHLESQSEFPICDAAHFVLIASTLVLIKSRSLLPILSLTHEEEEDIASLECRLKLYKRIKELSRHTETHFGVQRIFYREAPRHIAPVFSPTKEITLDKLKECVSSILVRLPKKEAIPQIVVEKIISIEEMIDELSERVAKSINMSFKEFTNPSQEVKMDVIVGFLAMLELVKRGVIHVVQNKHFEDIKMTRKS